MGNQSIEKDKILNYLAQKNVEKEIECEWLRNII